MHVIRSHGRRSATTLLVLALATIAILALPAPSRAEDPSQSPVIVYMADGSNLPLVAWSFSYEYDARREGAAAVFGSSARRTSQDLFSGKKALATAGGVLEIQYREYDQTEEVDGENRTTKITAASGLVLTVAGKRNELHLEAPAKEILVPQGAEKGTVPRARGLDLVGSTLTGTKRDFCLLAYVAEVECHPSAADRVVKIEFPK